ncbi:MAG: hypothetical protein QOF44_4712 [Streptomyces sp.]|nr:hypothetical protein [Streptomyces sp.]
MQFVESTGLSVRSAVWVLQRRETALRFHLFCMVHVGSQSFYDEVAERLGSCDVIVAEGYGQSRRRFVRLRLGLHRLVQRAGKHELVYQHVDYASFGVPVIWPDLDEPEPRDAVARAERPLRSQVLFLGFLLLLPVRAFGVLLLGGRRFLTRSLSLNVEDTTVFTGGGHVSAMVLDDRDDLLVAALSRLHDTRAAERVDVAVVYGAAHMPAVVRHLNAAYGYRPTGGEWLTVHGVRV